MHAVIVSTALRPGHKTAAGVTVDRIDLATEPLPMCDGGACYQDQRVRALTVRVKAANLVVVCFPVYNYQPNAAAKNFVEVTNDAWKDKVVAFVANAGGDRSYLAPLPLAGSLMVDHRCVIVPHFLYLPPTAFDSSGAVSLDGLPGELFEQQIGSALTLARAWTQRTGPAPA